MTLSVHRDYLSVEHLAADLKNRSVRGGAVMLLAQASNVLLYLGATVVLARVLTPADYGLVAMVTAFTGFVGLFKDMGLSTATIQRAEISHAQVSTLFWINVGVSVLLVLITAALAPAIAWFYDEPRLIEVTLAVAGVFLFGGLSAQHQALLGRRMRFVAMAAISVASMLTGVLAGIGCAWAGGGYWALVAMTAVSSLTNTISLWSACKWRPSPPARGSGVRSLLVFGSNLTGFNVVNYFARNLDNILIGWWWGAGSLGIYSKAYQLLMLPVTQINGPVSSVAIPVLSSLQNDPKRYRAFYKKGIGLMVTLGMPIVAFSFIAAFDIIILVLGEQWTPAAAVFQALAPAAFVGTLNVATGWVYASLGNTDRQLKAGVIVSLVLAIAFFIGLKWGAIGVALAYSIAIIATRPFAILYCFSYTPLRPRDLASTLWRPSVASLLSALLTLFIERHFWQGVDGPAAHLLLTSVLFAILYVGTFIALPGGRHSLSSALDLAVHLRRNTKSLIQYNSSSERLGTGITRNSGPICWKP